MHVSHLYGMDGLGLVVGLVICALIVIFASRKFYRSLFFPIPPPGSGTDRIVTAGIAALLDAAISGLLIPVAAMATWFIAKQIYILIAH